MTRKELGELMVSNILLFENQSNRSVVGITICDDRGGTGTFQVTIESTPKNGSKKNEFKTQQIKLELSSL